MCKYRSYLYLCKNGLPFVKNVYGSGKSYHLPAATADMSREPRLCRMLLLTRRRAASFRRRCALEKVSEKYLPRASAEYPALEQIIAQDAKLKYIYDSGVFELDVDGDRYPLISQILRKSREILYLTPISTVKLRMKKHMLHRLPVHHLFGCC